MEPIVFQFDDAVSTYAIADEPLDRFKNHLSIADGQLVVSYTSHTSVQVAHSDTSSLYTREIVVIGIAVDSHKKHDENPAQIADYLIAQEQDDIESIYRAARRFAGRFIVFYRRGNEMYLFGDAYGMLQINYAKLNGHFCAAVTDKLIGDYFNLEPSSDSLEVQYSGGLERPMPYDMTMYDGVKVLLANHYLDLSSATPHRIKLQVVRKDTKEDQQKVIDQTVFLVDNILDNYLAISPIACPLTGGHDSRVVFAFARRLESALKCYTLNHPGFTENHYDLAIPRKIAKDFRLDYTVYTDLIPPREYIDAISDVTGNWHSPTVISLGYTIETYLPGYIILPSDILDQLGRPHYLPECFATASFFNAKLHKYSSKTLTEMKKFVTDCSLNKDSISKFELNDLEIDGSRRVSQGTMIYGLIGIIALNPFNCGELIDLWLGLPQKLRAEEFIHNSLLNRFAPALKEYPINPRKKYARLQAHTVTYLLGTYGRYYLNKWKRLLF